jgi:Methane/Phenol/Toluene Hydroxylase/YHS domain
MAISLTKAYDRVKSIDWDPTYITQEQKLVEKTRFYLEGLKPIDPFKTFCREYFTMEQEKENRHYAILEASSRLAGSDPDPRWMEGMKFGLSNFSAIEYSAGRQMGRMARSVAPMELRQGYMMQVLDEMRHTQLEMNTLRHHMRSWRDPSGYDIALKAVGRSVGAGIFRSMCEDFMTCDPVETSLGLQLLVETAYSNFFFVGMSSAAAAHGDKMMASTMLTIQSDESRHMANGWATLVTLLQDDRNVPLIQEALDKWSWRIHMSFGVGNSLFADYFTTKRQESAKEMTMRWVFDEFYGGFYQKLEKYGINPPKHLDRMIADQDWLSHSAAVYLFGAWPVFYHRYDPMTAADMEWFEKKYPGWYGHYGSFWEAYNQMTCPEDGQLVIKALGGLPNFCQVCQLPTIFPRPDAHTGRSRLYKGKNYIFCSQGCEEIFVKEPDHYMGFQGFLERYNGFDLADVTLDMGFVREDGKTLIAQPVLEPKRMWTIDDIRRCQYEVKMPPPPPTSTEVPH